MSQQVTPSRMNWRVWDGKRMWSAKDYASLTLFDDGSWQVLWDKSEIYHDTFVADSSTPGACLMWSTGAVDCDGTEIFEHDLLQHIDRLGKGPELWVNWKGSSWCIQDESIRRLGYENQNWRLDEMLSLATCRVIGHIFEPGRGALRRAVFAKEQAH